MNLHDKALGFQTSFLTHFPLPRTNVGNEFRREINHILCVYMDPLGIPYTTNDRRWAEIATTLAKQTKDSYLQFGSVSQTLARYGMDQRGGQRGNIIPARKALYRFANLHIHTSRLSPQTGKNDYHQALNFAVGEKVNIAWAKGRTDTSLPELFDDDNYIQFSSMFMEFVDRAVPHVQEHYLDIQSPLVLDVYHWLVTKFYGLHEQRKQDELIEWVKIYAQFGQTGGRLSESQMKDMRRLIKAAVLEVCTKYYPKAKAQFTDEGLVLKRSPLLIEPDNKKAGYSLL